MTLWERIRLALAVLAGAEVVCDWTWEDRHRANVRYLEAPTHCDEQGRARNWFVRPDLTVWVPVGTRERNSVDWIGVVPVDLKILDNQRVTVVRWKGGE